MPGLIEFLAGGAEGDRTPDLVNAIHALSQLSYGPRSVGKPGQAFVLAARLSRPRRAIAQVGAMRNGFSQRAMAAAKAAPTLS
jgi:hypothetical protein